MVSSHQTRDLEYFADRSNTPCNLPTIHCPSQIATAPQMSPLLLCELPFQQSHLFLFCVVLTCNDSKKIPHRTWKIPRSCQCKGHLVSLSAPGTSLGSSGSLEKILLCTGRTAATVLPNLETTTAYRCLFRDSLSSPGTL